MSETKNDESALNDLLYFINNKILQVNNDIANYIIANPNNSIMEGGEEIDKLLEKKDAYELVHTDLQI